MPFKFNINISKDDAVRYTGLLFNLMHYVKKVLDDLKKSENNQVRNNFMMRLRLQTGMEIIVNQDTDYYLISMQQCKVEEELEEEKKK